MRLPKFDLVQPQTLADATRILDSEWPEVQPMAGGTDLLVSMKQRTRSPRVVVSLGKLPDVRGILFDAAQGTQIGALTTLSEVANSSIIAEHYPALAQAARSVGSPQIRNLGTLGGNLCLEKRCWYFNQSEAWRRAKGSCLRAGGERCFVVSGSDSCHAVVTADTATVLAALEAEIVAVGPSGTRRLLVSEFFAGLGDDTNVLRRGELVSEVHLPPPQDGVKGVYLRHSLRGAIDFPLVQVAVFLHCEDGICRAARIVLGAISSNPVRARNAEQLLTGKKLTSALAAQAAVEALREVKPIPYILRTPDYKRRLARSYMEAAIHEAASIPFDDSK